MMHRLALVVSVLVSVVALPSCVSMGGGADMRGTLTVEHPLRRPVLPARDVTPGPIVFAPDETVAWIDGVSGVQLSFHEVVERARAHRVVMVGEQHDQPVHHEVQRRVVEQLAADGGLVVGLEMLTWEQQSALDRFNSGALDVDALGDAVDWKKAWGFDFKLYRPILVDGHALGARFIALNAPRSLVKAVRTRGLDGLAHDEREQMPQLDLGDEAHKAWFAQIFSAGGHAMKASDLDAFYRAQVLWDEAMADRAARALQDGARRVVVLAGVGHVAAGRGVPQRIERRLPDERVFTIVPLGEVDAVNVVERVRAAVAAGEGDVLAVPRFDAELLL